MSFVRNFFPWFVFAAATAYDWRVGAVVGTMVTAIDIAYQLLRKGCALDSLVLELSTVAFFALLSLIAMVDKDSPVRHWSAALSLGWLAATAWLSLVVRQPFTLGIARKTVPEQVWSNPVFYRVNAVITAVWAATFTVVAVATVLTQVLSAGVAISVGIHFAYVVPIAFTIRYPKIVKARHGAMAAVSTGAAAPAGA